MTAFLDLVAHLVVVAKVSDGGPCGQSMDVVWKEKPSIYVLRAEYKSLNLMNSIQDSSNGYEHAGQRFVPLIGKQNIKRIISFWILYTCRYKHCTNTQF